DTRMRRIFVDGLHDAADEDAPEPPSPFGPAGWGAFAAWVTEPVAPSPRPRVSRYLARRPAEGPGPPGVDPSPPGEGAEAYFGALRDERNPYGIPDWVLPTEEDALDLMWQRWRERPAAPRPRGVNLVGYVTAVLGVGHVARVFSALLDAAATPKAV